MLCDGSNFKPIAMLADVGTAGNPGKSCKQIKESNPASTDGLYWIAPAGKSFQAWCVMSILGGGWTAIAWAPSRAKGETFQLTADQYALGDLSGGWNQMATAKGVGAAWFEAFRGYYRYLEDQPGIPQTGKSYDVWVEYKSKQGLTNLAALTSSDFGTKWSVETSEGAKCSGWYSLFDQYWNTLATNGSGGSGGHGYCGYYHPSQPSEGWCAQAYPVNSCNRGGYGKYVWAWYLVR
jgi:hypothetical protein